jgi:hypothetical protein
MQDDFDPEQDTARNAARKKRGKQRAKQDEDDMKWLMNDARGRRIAFRFLSRSGVFRISFTAGDPHSTSFNEGGRNLGLQMMNDINNVVPEQYALMLREAQDEQVQPA